MTRIALICLVVVVAFASALGVPTKAHTQVSSPSTPHLPPPADVTPCAEVDMKAIISVPSDFSIAYFEGPSHRDWPGRRVQVAVDTDGVVKYFVGNVPRRTRSELPLQQRKISKDKVREIYARVVACGFFDLNRNYRNPRIRDGGYRHLSITADGKTNNVSVSYYVSANFSAPFAFECSDA